MSGLHLNIDNGSKSTVDSSRSLGAPLVYTFTIADEGYLPGTGHGFL